MLKIHKAVDGVGKHDSECNICRDAMRIGILRSDVLRVTYFIPNVLEFQRRTCAGVSHK